LALGRGADQDFAVLGPGHDGRRGPVAFAVLDDPRLAAIHDRDARIGRAEVDADDLAHGVAPSRNRCLVAPGADVMELGVDAFSSRAIPRPRPGPAAAGARSARSPSGTGWRRGRQGCRAPRPCSWPGAG